jgi:hypothetical protein
MTKPSRDGVTRARRRSARTWLRCRSSHAAAVLGEARATGEFTQEKEMGRALRFVQLFHWWCVVEDYFPPSGWTRLRRKSG